MEALIWIGVVVFIFVGELLLKNRVERYIPARGKEKKEVEILGGRILLRKHHNKGLALNLGDKHRKLIAYFSLFLTIFFSFFFLFFLRQKGKLMLHAGMALLLGGAYSNTYDRLKRKYVVDYFSFGVKWKRLRNIVFNLSDLCIIIGAIFLAIGGEN